MGKIVLNIPHSSHNGVLEYGWMPDVLPFVERWTDWHTDYLFNSEDKRVKPVVFKLSRFVCDVERLIGDEMESVGQGICYERFETAERKMSGDLRREVYAMREVHIETLKSELEKGCMLIDCHSFPADLSDVEICIGYNEDWSKPDTGTLKGVSAIFGEKYRVAYNYPYSNSISPETGFVYGSMMIEVNKSVYMDGLKMDVERAGSLKSTIERVYKYILGKK